MTSINVRSIDDIEAIRQIEEVQRRAWGMDDIEIIPSRFMHAMRHNGACLLGAYDGDQLVGFVFGVLATVEGLKDRIDQVAAARLQMYSAIMGVLPEYQVHGVGYRLKLGQREYALRLGVRLITWTYDPLESRNAYFNVGKLGVVCHQYLRDFHGQMGGINAGLASDRFHVEWWITSNRVQRRTGDKRAALGLEQFEAAGATLVNEAARDEGGLLRPLADFARPSHNVLLVEIPADFQAIKRQDMALAQAWRQHTRDLFEHYFNHNYLVTDFVRHEDASGAPRSYYVLTYKDS